jgi:hypothetical protein
MAPETAMISHTRSFGVPLHWYLRDEDLWDIRQLEAGPGHTAS